MQDLKLRLEKRGISNPDTIVQIVDRYNLKPNIRNFDSYGFILRDDERRSVRVLSGKYRDDVIHLPRVNADIAVVFVDEMLLGWVSAEEIIDAEDRVMIKTKMIESMPDSFSFKKTCPHLEEYGGFLEGDYWECAGCGKEIKAFINGS